MRILVIGGTRFVGRSFVEEALAAGHELTLFNRGRTAPELFADVEHVRGDRDVSLDAVAGGSWDVVFDPSCYLPRHARTSATTLVDSVEHYTFISSLSAYADETTPDQGESGPLAELVDPANEDIWEHYGALKVASEREVQRVFGDRALVLRPGFIGGPYDQVDRMPWWLRRLAKRGEVLVPGEPEDRVQVIDARDIATFALALAGRREGGVFNLCAPADGFEMRELLDACAAAVGATDATYTFVPEAFLLEHGVSDDEPVPYWVGTRYGALRRFDPSKAFAAGLVTRPIEETFRDCWAWDRARVQEPLGVGLEPEREAQLLSAWNDARPSSGPRRLRTRGRDPHRRDEGRALPRRGRRPRAARGDRGDRPH